MSSERSRAANPLAVVLAALVAACAPEPGTDSVSVPGFEGAQKSAAVVRAERRLFDGAPPVIPHENFGAACISCHDREGMAVEGVGFSPPSPHAETAGMSAMSRCEQCHVRQPGHDAWVENTFAGLRQDLRRGKRLNPLAPPVIPHLLAMRENCVACHSGPAAREEIRTDHPERARCQQCHLEPTTTGSFEPGI